MQEIDLLFTDASPRKCRTPGRVAPALSSSVARVWPSACGWRNSSGSSGVAPRRLNALAIIGLPRSGDRSSGAETRSCKAAHFVVLHRRLLGLDDLDLAVGL
jgi:hypothetical protein